MTSVSRSAKKAKDAENSSSSTKYSGVKAVSGKGSPVSRPESNDISTLRSRESVVKKQQSSCSSSDLRKSNRLENRGLTTSPSKNTLSSEEKRSMPSPPSKCERGNKQHHSSSSNGKRFEKESGLSESKECKKNQTSLKLDHLAGNKQETVENVIGCKQEVVEEEMWQSEEGIKLVRKKRLDARTFRKIIGPKIEDARNSGDDRHTKGENRLSQSKGTSHLIVGKDFVKESSCTKVENLKRMHPNEEACQATEFSSCGSDDGERENANLSSKQELHFEKVQDLESGEHPPRTNDCSLPIAFDGIEVRDGQQVKNNEMARLSDLAKDTPPAIGLISAGQVTAECHVPERKDITDMDYDVSATSLIARTCMDKASVSSSPRIQNEDLVDLCSACAKPKRINTVPEIQNTISFCDRKCHPTNSSCCQDGAYGISSHERQQEEQSHIVEEEESVLDNHDNENNTCAKCELGGKLLCCDAKGCVKSYHLYCLDPPLSLVPLGAWFCQVCLLKKTKLGIYSVSPGMEAICDSKEIDNEGCNLHTIKGKLEKQYFVKYKGLAHVHNRWVPERQLSEEAPALIDKFKKKGWKNKALSWSSDWLVPQRLLKKRAITLLKGADSLIEESPKITSLPCEWLVKWKGLGYEGCTWELDNTPLFTSSEAILLKSDYEQRMRRAKEYSNHKRVEKILNSRKGPLPTALKLPGIASAELVQEYLTSVNKILEFWYRCQNTIVIDDKERVVKIVLFILSLKSYVPFPVLIISTSPYLVQWEAAFMQFDKSLNVVVYAGDKNVRSNIQMLEFYEDGGGVMLEVLLSTPEAILEDLDSLKHIDSWGVIVVDVSYGSKLSEYLEQIRNLSSDFKLLLASGQIKDDVLFNILSFLGEENIEHMDPNDNAVELAIFKEKLTQLVAYEHNTAQPKFLEYWVPIPLSNVQLEQYCCILLENFLLLRSCLKNDHVGILSDVLKSARKCCEHPYLVNPTLQTALTKGLPEPEYLHIGVNSSGKLQFLDRILFEMKNQGQRVLILFQTVIGAEKISLGNILDDFLRQRFGEETYERVDFGVVKGRRDAALNMFNNIKQGRFVFLLEIRACRSCIKLCSVDAVIIFGSEWSPINDLKALMRIHIDSASEKLKVFRLYTPFTLEEKLLLLANEDGASPDSSLQNVSPATCRALLTWGASYLFQKLDEFHDPSKLKTTSEAYSYCVDLNDVVREVLVTHKNTSMKETVKQLLTEVHYNGTTYTLKGSLVGVAYMQGKDDDVPSTFFWCSLLEGRSPQWKYLSATSQRTRKKTMYYIDEAEIERDEIRKKRQKSCSSTVEPVALKIWNEERKKACFWQKEDSYPSFSSLKDSTTNLSGPEKEEAFVSKVDDRTEDMHGSDLIPGTISTLSENAVIHLVESEESRNLRDAQRALHIQLKPALSQLCHIFRLPDNVKDMAEMLLEYIMNTFHINRDAKRILDAFLLSLCWIAASLTRYKVNRDESFLLAKNLLGFECKEQEAESVYSKLKSLKKRFVKETRLPENRTDSNSQEKQPMAGIDPFLAKETGGLSTGQQDVGVAEVRASVSEQIIVDHLHVYGGATEDVGQEGDGKCSPDLDTGVDSEQAHVLKGTCDQIELICKARNEEIEKRQRDEIKHFNDVKEGLMENLKSKYGLSVCFSSKFEKLVWHMDKCFGKLTDKQREAREMERRLKARWLQDARAGSLIQSFDGIPLSETQFNLEELRVSAESIVCEDCEDTVSTSGTSCPTVESGNTGMLNHKCQIPSVGHVNASAGYAEYVDAPVQECSTPSLVEQSAVSMGVPLLVGSPQRDTERARVGHVLQSDSQEVAMSVLHSVDQPTAQFQQSGRSQVPTETRANTIAAVISEFSNHPPQTSVLNVTTHGPQFFAADPLQNELEKIHRQKEITTKMMDDEKKRLSKEWEKEVEEINKKYKSLIQDADVRLQQTHETLDLNYRRVFLSRILAEAYKYKSASPKVPLQAAQGMSHTAQQLSSITSSVPLTSHSEVRVVGSAPPRQVVQHSSALFSGEPLSQQLPVISRTSFQVGAEMRATLPHLQMRIPSSTAQSISSSLFTSPLLRQMDDHPRSTAQNLVPAPSDPVLLCNTNFDAWLTSQKEQASRSRPFDPAMGGLRETRGDNVVCLSDEE